MRQLQFQRQMAPYQPAFVQMTSEFVRWTDIIFNFQNLLPAEISEVFVAGSEISTQKSKSSQKWPKMASAPKK